MIIERLELGPFGTNCYLVGDESSKEGVIIDPGAEADRILKRVDALGMEIKFIVLTHAHIDHITALGKVKKATGAEITIHADEAGALKSGHLTGAIFGMSVPPLPSPDKLLRDGDKLNIGDLGFLVLHTPGHSRGGICLLGDGVVFSGDTLFNFGIGRTDLPGGSYNQLMNSIHTKLMVLPDNTTVYPGHGPESTIGTERHRNPFLHDNPPF